MGQEVRSIDVESSSVGSGAEEHVHVSFYPWVGYHSECERSTKSSPKLRGGDVLSRSRYVSYKKAQTEPNGWPLNRRATTEEWRHVLKAKLVQRVPKTRSVPGQKLLAVVRDDIAAADLVGKIYLGPDSENYIDIRAVLNNLINDKVLGLTAEEIVRTDFTDEWEKLIPATVRSVLNFFPVTDILDLLVDALIDDES